MDATFMHISPPSTSKVAGNGASGSRSNWVGVARSIITLTERPQETAAAEGSVSNAADGSEPVVEQTARVHCHLQRLPRA